MRLLEAAVRTIAAGVIYAFDRQREPVPQNFFFQEEVPPQDKVKAPLIVSRDAASIGGVDITPELRALQRYWASLPGAGAYENLLDAFAATVELYGDMAVASVSQPAPTPSAANSSRKSRVRCRAVCSCSTVRLTFSRSTIQGAFCSDLT